MIVVTGQDVNAISADAVVVPVDATLRVDRRLAASVLGACDPSVTASLGRLADVAVMGLTPGTVLRLPAIGHPHVGELLLVVLFDGREGGQVEPDEARLDVVARALVSAWRSLGLQRVVVPNLAGRVLDAGEVAATVAGAARQAAVSTTVIFCDRDPVTGHDMGAAIESLGLDVSRT